MTNFYIETEQGIQAMTAEELPINKHDFICSFKDSCGDFFFGVLCEDYQGNLALASGESRERISKELKIHDIEDKRGKRSHVPVMMHLYLIDGKYYTSAQVPYGEGSRVYAKTKKVEVWMRR